MHQHLLDAGFSAGEVKPEKKPKPPPYQSKEDSNDDDNLGTKVGLDSIYSNDVKLWEFCSMKLNHSCLLYCCWQTSINTWVSSFASSAFEFSLVYPWPVSVISMSSNPISSMHRFILLIFHQIRPEIISSSYFRIRWKFKFIIELISWLVHRLWRKFHSRSLVFHQIPIVERVKKHLNDYVFDETWRKEVNHMVSWSLINSTVVDKLCHRRVVWVDHVLLLNYDRGVDLVLFINYLCHRRVDLVLLKRLTDDGTSEMNDIVSIWQR